MTAPPARPDPPGERFGRVRDLQVEQSVTVSELRRAMEAAESQPPTPVVGSKR
jgi:hypothetical protein